MIKIDFRLKSNLGDIMASLILNLKKEYFLQIKSGEKKEELRLVNDYWSKRLENKVFDNVIIRLGYCKAGDKEREVIRPWKGYCKKIITHKHFGNNPVLVYAINLE